VLCSLQGASEPGLSGWSIGSLSCKLWTSPFAMFGCWTYLLAYMGTALNGQTESPCDSGLDMVCETAWLCVRRISAQQTFLFRLQSVAGLPCVCFAARLVTNNVLYLLFTA